MCRDPDVEAWLGSTMYRIEDVSQFSVVPDVVLTLGEKELEFST